MKIFFLSASLFVCCGLLSNSGFAQKDQLTFNKNEEIIIRKNDAKVPKTIIEIDSNHITVNGQPLGDYNGGLTITKRNSLRGFNGENQFINPGQGFGFSDNSNAAFLGVLTAKTEKGAVINNVVDSGSAKKAGLKKGDIIFKFGNTEIASPADLRKAVHAYEPGDKVTVHYLRNGSAETAEVTLGKPAGFFSNGLNSNQLKELMNRFGQGNTYNYRIPSMPNSEMPSMPGNHFNFNHNQSKIGLKIEDTPEGKGVKILEVQKGSPAEKAGLKKNDLITEINGEKVNSANQVKLAILQSRKNDYKIKVKRNQNEMNFNVSVLKTMDL